MPYVRERGIDLRTSQCFRAEDEPTHSFFGGPDDYSILATAELYAPSQTTVSLL